MVSSTEAVSTTRVGGTFREAASDGKTSKILQHPQATGTRQFGTILSSNSSRTPQRKVKVKRATRKLVNSEVALPEYVTYSVAFGNGPIGLQLEEDDHSVVRVQRFVDGGDSLPGPARKSGLIKPGDSVTAVNGHFVTSYDQALVLLQDQSGMRELTFRRRIDVHGSTHLLANDPNDTKDQASVIQNDTLRKEGPVVSTSLQNAPNPRVPDSPEKSPNESDTCTRPPVFEPQSAAAMLIKVIAGTVFTSPCCIASILSRAFGFNLKKAHTREFEKSIENKRQVLQDLTRVTASRRKITEVLKSAKTIESEERRRESKGKETTEEFPNPLNMIPLDVSMRIDAAFSDKQGENDVGWPRSPAMEESSISASANILDSPKNLFGKDCEPTSLRESSESHESESQSRTMCSDQTVETNKKHRTNDSSFALDLLSIQREDVLTEEPVGERSSKSIDMVDLKGDEIDKHLPNPLFHQLERENLRRLEERRDSELTINTYKSLLDKSMTEIADLRRMVENIKSTEKLRIERAQELAKLNTEMSNELSELKEVAERNQAELLQKRTELIERNDHCEDLYNELLSAKEESNQWKTSAQSKQNTNLELKSLIASMETELGAEKKGMETKIEELSAQIQRLQNEKSTATETISSLEAKFAATVANRNSLEETSERKDAEIGKLRESLDEISSSFDNERNRLNDRVAAEATRAERLHDLLIEANKDVHMLQMRLATQNQHFSKELGRTVAEAEQLSEAYEEERSSMEDELNQLHQKMSAQEAHLAEAHARGRRLEELVEQNKLESSRRLASAIGAHKSELELQTDKRQEAERLCDRMKSENEEIRTKLCKIEADLVSTSTERDYFLSERAHLSAALYQTEGQLYEAQIEIEQLKQQSCELSMDSSFSELSGLKRDELKAKYKELQAECSVAQKKTLHADDELDMKNRELSVLTGNVSDLRSEMHKLVVSNDKLDERLQCARADNISLQRQKEELLKLSKSNRAAISGLQNDLEQQRLMNASLSSLIDRMREQAKAKQTEYDQLKGKHSSELANLQKKVVASSQAADAAKSEVDSVAQALSSVREEKEVLFAQAKDLETQLQRWKKESQEYSDGNMLALSELSKQLQESKLMCLRLEEDCELLRDEARGINVATRSQEQKWTELKEHGSFNQQATEVLRGEVDELRRNLETSEDRVTALEEALADRESKISVLEQKLTISMSSSEKLQQRLQELTSTVQSKDSFRENEVRNLASKCSMLENDRLKLSKDVFNLRNEAKKLRMDSSTQRKANVDLQKRLDSMKLAGEKGKSQLGAAGKAKDEAESQVRKLEAALKNQEIEVERQQSKIQVLTATVSRMKAENTILQQEATQPGREPKTTSEEDAQLSFEKELVSFVEEVICEAETSFRQVLARSREISEMMDETCNQDLTALDLAHYQPHQKTLSDVKRNVDSLMVIVPRALTYLSSKLVLLKEWKTYQQLPVQSRKSDFSDSAAMKELIGSNNGSAKDTKILQEIVVDLESQIDSLLLDLKAANDALQTKERLFSDLEQLVEHHETERQKLEEQLTAMSSRVQNLEMALKENEKKAQVQVLNPFNTLDKAPSDSVQDKRTAIDLVRRVMEGRLEMKRALSFHHWASETMTSRALSRQQEEAAAMLDELGATREKLSILKKHLKKSRRGREPSLDRIVEGFVVS